MNLRLTVTAGIAVVLASLPLSAVIDGNGWLGATIGAVIVVGAVGSLTRMSGLRSAVAATFLVLLGVIPLLAGPNWGERAAGLVIVALTAASATGMRLLRGFAILGAYGAGLLLYLNFAFASAESYGHLLPSQSSVTVLGQLYRAAFSDFKYAPPVPDAQGVSLIATGGIGIIAILVDILAVRLRRPAVAGLPLLLLFSVPVASNLKTFGAVQIITFVAALAGFLALLSADGRERLRMWGRLVTFRYVQPADDTGVGPDTRELAASGRRIGLAAMCLAVIVPLVLPAMHTQHLFDTVDDGPGHGGTRVELNALLLVQDELASKQEPVLTYKTTSTNPEEQYLEEYVLNYSASQNAWLLLSSAQQSPLRGGHAPFQPAGMLASTPTQLVRTTVQYDKDQSGEAFLVAPYAPVSVTSSGSGWLETPDSLMIYNPNQSPSGLRYTVESREADPQASQLDSQLQMPNAIDSKYGGYNGPDVSQLTTIAAQHATGSTELQKALSLQAWFTSGHFAYTLKPNLPSTGNWLLKFLTSDRRGECRQFAWAFAVLARLAGIPSRIAVGYTAGTLGADGSWQVTTADAHAWPELYFPGVGWLRFEPTPGANLHGQGTATTPDYATGPAGGGTKPQVGSPQPNPSTAITGPGAGRRPPVQNRFGGGTGGVSAPGQATSPTLALAIGIPIAVLLLLGWPALTRLLTRRRRWLTASGDAAVAHAAWRELTDNLTDYGLGSGAGETPRAVARRVTRAASLDPAAAQAITRLSGAEEWARYARAPQPAAGLAADVRTVRRAVAASVPRRQRVRARLAPQSTLLAARRLLQRTGDLLNWIDSPLPIARRQLNRSG